MTYPSPEQLIARVKGDKPDDSRAAELIKSAVTAWEGETRWSPFLAKEGTLVCNGPLGDGYEIFPKSGVIALDSIRVLKGDGGTDREDLDSNLWRLNRPKDDCYLSVYFPYGQWPGYGAIELVGTFGRYAADNLPADVYEAILSHALGSWYGGEQGSGGPIKSYSAGPVKYEFAMEAGRDPVGRNMATFDKTAKRYRRRL